MCDADLGAEGGWRGEYVFGGERVSCCKGNIIRHLLFDDQEGSGLSWTNADALFEPGRETGSVN